MIVLNEVMDVLYSDCDKLYRSGYYRNKNVVEIVQFMVNDLL